MLKSGVRVTTPLRSTFTLAMLFASPAIASVSTSGCAALESCSLAELVRGGRIDVNGQRFEGFEIERQTRSIDLEQIRVSGLDADPDQAGLLFVGGSEWRVLAGDFLGVRIGHRVRSLVPGTATAGVRLDLVFPQTIEEGSLLVDQTTYDAKGRRLGGAAGEQDAAFETSSLSDSTSWSGRTEILGETELFLAADAPTDEAILDGVEIRYALPEPASTAGLLAGIGLVALHSRRSAPRRDTA